MTSEKHAHNLTKKIRGVVFPILTPFTPSDEVDYTGLHSYVDFLIAEGAKTLMVTVGTSRFSVLTTEEMLRVNTAVSQAAKGRAVVIVTGPPQGPASASVEFARHAAEAGADALLVVYPDRFYSEEAVLSFFASIAEASPIPIMIHLASMRPGRGGTTCYSPDLLERLANLDNLVGIKEEMLDNGLTYAYNRRLAERFVIIGGAGGMKSYLTAHMWGQPAYLAGIGNFSPRAELAFVQALEQRNLDLAIRIVNDLETPFFQVAIPQGWHVALKEAMHGLDLMSPEERLPMARVEQEARKAVQDVARDIVQKVEGMCG